MKQLHRRGHKKGGHVLCSHTAKREPTSNNMVGYGAASVADRTLYAVLVQQDGEQHTQAKKVRSAANTSRAIDPLFATVELFQFCLDAFWNAWAAGLDAWRRIFLNITEHLSYSLQTSCQARSTRSVMIPELQHA